ncbi:MAG: DUF1905 domain-containing protein [Bacteroidota bacterium]|nr:DUF1905 domain-containing protein [Bacteroidota bacterium]
MTMIRFTTIIRQFGEKGEKTGWTYVAITKEQIEALKPDARKSFRVKGKLDQFPVSGVALLPMGGGDFILPLNAVMRKGIHKKKGAQLTVQLAVDTQPLQAPEGFYESLADEPEAERFFAALLPSHRNYFIKWMGGVKSPDAQANRIAAVITALSRKQNFVEMIRAKKALRDPGK